MKLFLVVCRALPTRNDDTINPNIYPPVGPVRYSNPLPEPVNTDSPVTPSSIYPICDNAPKEAPKTAPDKTTKKVCKVKGTGVKGKGMRTYAPAVVSKIKTITPTVLQSALSKIISLFHNNSIPPP